MGRIEYLLLCAAALWFAACGFADFPHAAATGFQDAKIEHDDQEIMPFVQAFAPQFREFYRSELHFMRLVCQPTKAQFEKISANGETRLDATIRDFAVKIREQSHGNADSAGEFAEPLEPIAPGILESVRTILSPEQASSYQKEVSRRVKARKRALLLSLVAKADTVLFLTLDQRGKLLNTLEEKWNSSMNYSHNIIEAGSDLFPQMPDREIFPILTESQRTVWRSVRKGTSGFGFGLRLQGIKLDDEVWADGKAPAKPKKIDAKTADLNQGKPKRAEKK